MKNIRKTVSIILASLIIFTSFAFAVSAEEECNHLYSATNVAPNCVDAGYTLYACPLCGDSYKDYKNGAPTLGHNYGVWYDIDEASCIAEGHAQRDCTRCTASEIKTIPIIAHKDADSNGKCDICETAVEVEEVFSPFDWLVAFFRAVVQWFRDIFA